jgi:hypothetical protein
VLLTSALTVPFDTHVNIFPRTENDSLSAVIFIVRFFMQCSGIRHMGYLGFGNGFYPCFKRTGSTFKITVVYIFI